MAFSRKTWDRARLRTAERDRLWELFQENSKLTVFDPPLSNEGVLQRMAEQHEVYPYAHRPVVKLPPARSTASIPLSELIARRTSAETLEEGALEIEQLADLLHAAYGVTRTNQGTPYPRPFRAVPSAGALYPLELFVHAQNVASLPNGPYHYHPHQHVLHQLARDDSLGELASAFIQPEFVAKAGCIVLIAAVFRRSTFKYGARGVRFAYLEAGHVAQNLCLSATAMDLGSRCLGGYVDSLLDAHLGLDGVTSSVIYAVGVGRAGEAEASD